MIYIRKIWFLTLALAAGIAAFGIGSHVVSGSEPPPPAPYDRPDGTVDLNKVPECIGAVGPDGKTVLDETGKPLCIPGETYFAPPPPPGVPENRYPGVQYGELIPVETPLEEQ